jgi:hypothetical protein
LVLLVFPKAKVFFQQLNNAFCVTEIVFFKFINLVKGVLEGLVCKITGCFVVLHDLVVEHREVQCKAKLDWVAWRQGDLVGFVVGLQSFLFDLFHLLTLCILCNVAIIVADHFNEERF